MIYIYIYKHKTKAVLFQIRKYEMIKKLNTLISCDKSRELATTLWQMRQKLDSIINSRPDDA